MNRRRLALALLFPLAACRSGTSEPAAAVPAAPASAEPSVAPAAQRRMAGVAFPDGSRLLVELAETPEERERGLMFRQTIAPDEGMLFVFDRDEGLSFWMKNTFIDLDMVWLDAAGKVQVVHENVPRSKPGMGDGEVATRGGHGLYVLELAAGQAAARQIKAGASLALTIPPR